MVNYYAEEPSQERPYWTVADEAGNDVFAGRVAFLSKQIAVNWIRDNALLEQLSERRRIAAERVPTTLHGMADIHARKEPPINGVPDRLRRCLDVREPGRG